MEMSEEHVKTLLAMGFPSEMDVRKALKLAKNDLNDAVAILTNDHPSSNYDTLDEIDVEMKELHAPKSNATQVVYGPSLPPTYDEAMTAEKPVGAANEGTAVQSSEPNALEFPVTNLYELEGRVFTDRWSIPFRKEESLGKCLLSATKLAESGLCENDEHCKRFMDRCLPEAFHKLMTAPAVHGWVTEVQEGVFSMLQLLIDLIVARLQYQPMPLDLLEILSLVFNPESAYHFKNRARRDRTSWDEKLDAGQPFAVMPSNTFKVDPYGWLTHLINRFALKGGFDTVKKILENDELDAPSMAALLKPFGLCAEYFNPNVVQSILAPGMERVIKYVQGLENKDFKEKKIGSVSDLLASMKLLCIHLWSKDVPILDELRLDIALRMLKCPHFNAKMNSLKEVTKLIEDCSGTKLAKTAIHPDSILDWLLQNKVLSIALEGSIDQVQYCDKIKGIVEFLGAKLLAEELTMIWKMQVGQTNNVIDNIHSIIAAAAVKFDSQQLEHLFLLIQKKWQEETDRMREKLLSLIGRIGKDGRLPKTTTRVLELLWDLAHLPVLSTRLIEHALDEHLAILTDSDTVKEQVKKHYVVKCVEDIKKGGCVLPFLKQLHLISRSILKQTFHKTDKSILQELKNNYDVIKLVTSSLVKCHKQVVSSVGDGQLGPDTVVDGRYLHSDYVSTHLSFLQYILQEGVFYLPWNRARDIWTTLVSSNEACHWDRETCYEWFKKSITDLEAETQNQFFQKELLHLEPTKLSAKGFECFHCYFESVNSYEQKLKKTASQIIVEKSDLLGLDYLWEICLNALDETIADSAIQLLLNMLYTNLSSRYKKDPVSLHQKFITVCYNRLETAMFGVGGTVLAKTVSSATKTLTAAIVPEVANIPLPSGSAILLNIERLLWIAEMYVLGVEELHTSPRSIPPHGASFQGHQINLFVTCESNKQEFVLVCHSNETLESVRQKVAHRLQQSTENIQIVANDKMHGTIKDQKLLHQLEFEDNQSIQVRLVSKISTNQSVLTKEPILTPSAKQTFDMEQEKLLPGVVMAIGGQVFEMLYQLAELDEDRITSRVQRLLMLIPTDPAVSDALDSITQKGVKSSLSSEDLSPRASPKKQLTPSLSSPRPPPQEILKSLFDITGTDMSPFRVLYNLEVLSSKLMPATEDIGTHIGAQTFCNSFLSAGGLQLVVSILQPESFPSETNYQIRQGCYSICLQLARFLLCGQSLSREASPDSQVSESTKEIGATAATASAAAVVMASNIPIAASSIPEIVTSGCSSIQQMGHHEFTQTVSCFLHVTWAAAAGRLHLLSTSRPIRECPAGYGCGHRSRQSSTGSTASTGSESDCQSLHAGVCAQQATVSMKDVNIAKEALEILVTCLQLRSELVASFYNMPCVGDFVIDLLVASPQTEIRSAALEQFYVLSQTENTGENSAHKFMLQVLLKAYLPFWVTSSTTRGASQRILGQCLQYFELRCRLLENLTVSDQEKFQVDLSSMLEDELAWLCNFVTSNNAELQETDNCLLAGHLKLVKTLLTCEGVKKEEYGENLVYDLLHEFLFPAAKVMLDSLKGTTIENCMSDFNPKCSTQESRIAAYELLIELANDCLTNQLLISKQLIQMHHLMNSDCSNEWEYLPPVDGRASCGYVGLKNAGATCYMNSVIQQIYMAPNIPEAILSVDEDNCDEESVFHQIQQVFGHLMDSKLQYHEPEKFWKVFRLWGQEINVREQQDAFDFFQALVDQVDEYLKKIGKEELFKKKFQGIFSDQKICKDCPHRYEREEAFFALNLTVKNATLQDSLDQFVKGELLEGDNAYFCEKCGEKRNTIKRMCVKTLPSLLCIQLKRFGYDWEANRALKFDDHFKFPWVLDMEPYTTEGMARREAESASSSGTDSDSGEINLNDSGSNKQILPVNTHHQSKQINYELVGVVVHSGQANAGHYYSYIKDRRGTVLTNPNKGKWFKFNDTVVEEFEMNDTNLEAECFGGTYKAKVYENQSNVYPEERQRYWNGYLLFYEKMEELKTPASAKKSKILTRKHIGFGGRKGQMDSDSLMELTELVHKGEHRGIFVDKMSARIQQVIQAENLTFVKNRDVYNQEYFKFVKSLVARNTCYEKHEDFSSMCLQALQLGVKFLFNTYFRTKMRTSSDVEEWVDVVDTLVNRCKPACLWLIEYLSAAEGSSYIKPFLLECPTREVRFTFAKILERVISAFFYHGGLTSDEDFDRLIENLLLLLNKDVGENCKHCVQYFFVLRNYVQSGTNAVEHILKRDGFQRIISFLLGPNVNNHEKEGSIRHWSSLQSRDFSHLHATLAILILNCDVSKYRTEDPGDFDIRTPLTIFTRNYLKMSSSMESFVFGAQSHLYLKEVIQAIREIGGNLQTLFDMLVCCSFCNKQFSINIIKQLIHQYSTASSNELKPIFSLLLEILMLEDPLHITRIQWIIDDQVDEDGSQYDGLLAIIRLNNTSDSRRSYQCIKFLVNLANKSSLAKDYLVQSPSKWQWAVNWLKKKMSEYLYPSPTIKTNEDSNRKSFQRTVSAQDTLEEATALLTELEAHESQMLESDNNSGKKNMETDTNKSEQSESDTTQTNSDSVSQGSSTSKFVNW